MEAADFLLIAGLAAVDSLNPFTIAALAYLLCTPRPMARSLTFVGGTFLTYWLGGVMLLQGWLVIAERLARSLPWWAGAAALLVAGVASLAAAIYAWWQARAGRALTPPANLSIPATIAFTVGSTAADLPTAIPYFVAIEAIGGIGGTLPRELALIGYNLIYCLPLIGMYLAWLMLGERSRAVFDAMRQGVDWGFAKLMPPALALLGMYLVWAGGVRLLVR